MAVASVRAIGITARAVGFARAGAIAAGSVGRAVAIATAFGLLGEPGDGDDALALLHLEQRDALGLAAGDADVVHRAADELPAIGHQHDLIAVGDGERRDDLAVALGDVHVGDALPAAAGDAVLIGRGALAIAAGGDGEDELLLGPQLGIAFRRDCRLRGFLAFAFHRRLVADDAAARLQVGDALAGVGVHVAQDRHGDDVVALLQLDAAYADRGAAREHAHVVDREADGLAAGRRQQHVVVLGAGLNGDEPVALLQLHRHLAVGLHLDEVGELVPADRAFVGGEHHGHLVPPLLVLGQRHEGGDGLALLQRQQIHQRLAARLRRAQRQAVDLELVGDARGGEEQHRRVGVHYEQLGDEILVPRRHSGTALAAAALGAIARQRHALDVAAVGDGQYHVLALDQVLDVLLELEV